MVALYARVYGHDRTTASTYINDNVVVCVLENILTADETRLVAADSGGRVIDGRVVFQTETEDEFTAAVERLTRRRVVAFISANQTSPWGRVGAVLPRAPHVGPAGASGKTT